jgi:hypothetical protein
MINQQLSFLQTGMALMSKLNDIPGLADVLNVGDTSDTVSGGAGSGTSGATTASDGSATTSILNSLSQSQMSALEAKLGLSSSDEVVSYFNNLANSYGANNAVTLLNGLTGSSGYQDSPVYGG